MDSDDSIQTISSVTAEFFPQHDRKVVEVPFYDDATKRGRAFLDAVAGAKGNICLELQAGTYPAFSTKRNVFIRAAIPGTVEIIASPGQPALLAAAPCVRLQGISLCPAAGDGLAVAVRSGSLILKDCEIRGTVVTGAKSRLYLATCRVLSPGVGLHVGSGSTASVETSAFLNCSTGAAAEEGSRLSLRHARFHGCGRNDPASPGAAVRATKASLKCSGCRFVDNEKGVELVHCKEASLTACLFDSNTLGAVIAHEGKPPKMYAVQFWGTPPGVAAQVQLPEGEADMPHCIFNEASLQAGIVSEADILPESAGPLESHLLQLKKIAVSREIKGGLEAILRNAQSAFQWIEQGLPIPLQLFHCVFEGEPHLGQHRVAALLANSLKELGFLSTSELVEVSIDDVLLRKQSVEDIVRKASGGAILLHVSRVLNTREAHSIYTRTREILEAFIAAAGNSSILSLCGERDSIRPVLKKSALAEALGEQIVPFAAYTPGELLHVFTTLCENHGILLTPRAIEKLLITFYMLDDRRDRRFTTSASVRSLFEASEKQHRQRCAEQHDSTQPMDEGDLHLPFEQIANRIMAAQPALIAICPQCGAVALAAGDERDGVPLPALRTQLGARMGDLERIHLFPTADAK